MTHAIIFVYITAPSLEIAETIGRSLVADTQLAACVNYWPGMKSIYRWQGQVEHEDEVVMIAKTTSDRLEAVTQEVKRLHPYKVPCIVALPIESGDAPYLAWIKEQVS